jgi:hypothetical protein
MSNFLHIGTTGFTQGCHGTVTDYALGEESIGDEFGELRRPEVVGDDTLLRPPMVVDPDKALDCSLAGGRAPASNEDTIGSGKIVNGGSFGPKLWVRQDLK